MTGVTLASVRKTFGDVVAVNDVDLRVEDGEFVVIVGPSGCGKSTTLRLIAGLEEVTDGQILLGETDVTGLEPKDRSVTMVFQNYALYPHMTARRNITFGLDSDGSMGADEIESLVNEAAQTLDIADLLDRKPKALSGGERQRVALGRAIVRDPDVFLLDEPLSNLDAKLRIKMRAELAKLHKRFRTTTIYVTHDQTEAMTLGDRVVVLNEGRIQQVDPPQRLYDYPKNEFVAEFIGDPAMNMFDVKLRRGDAGVLASHPEFELRLLGTAGIDHAAGAAVRLGIRPEDLSLAGTAGEGDITARVTVTEPLGDSLLLECEVGDDGFKASVSPRRDIESGDRIALSCDPDRVHLFDAESGRAIYHSADTCPRIAATESGD